MSLSGLIPVEAQTLRQPHYAIVAEPHDQRPGAITRPANQADREWRRTRRTPELRTTVNGPQSRPFVAPRYDAYGRRRNVPGRPDTLDQYGRARLGRPSVTVVPSGPTVRADAATRINQLAPRR
ncbi:hypothetical protein IHQ68_01055 [Chelatococcus sambhunathii]|uniref:Uncharacterized protein n=1 Tax=Chelatococcus sambhunathii TaxID=363953 RepID=A0ABU1DAS9_9HYPH|nr:hypothetical protein [Chelatococcus sambhunathii]MDR4305214.1 hypothetical protein [Chelatococcus sambhunathii]